MAPPGVPSSPLPDAPPSSTEIATPSGSPTLQSAPASHTQTPTPGPADMVAADPVPRAQTTAERAFQHGLNRNNLEQEVGQVMGTLSGWWGGVKKQSASALSSIKADIDKTVQQAQADLEHLRTAKVEVVRKDPAQSEAEKAAESECKGKAQAIDETPTTESTPSFPQTATALLGRLTSSTSQLQSTLQSTFQATIAANTSLSNPAQLRAQLAENLRLSSARENLQLSVKQAEKLAEEYLRKGDQWVKDAEKWVGEAVKVVPPEGEPSGVMSWDGSDWYSFSTSSTSTAPRDTVIFDNESKTPRASISGAPLASSRKEALMRRLRDDKDLLLVDPGSEAETSERREAFGSWLNDKWDAANKKERTQEEGHVGSIRMALVPEHLTDEQFWQRYLFHKHMIEAEDEKRKQLLQASQEQQDDFSWDDEPEDNSALSPISRPVLAADPRPEPVTTPTAAHGAQLPSASAGKSNASTSTSPRDSEEYDLVSDQGAQKPAAPPADDDEDSDWE